MSNVPKLYHFSKEQMNAIRQRFAEARLRDGNEDSFFSIATTILGNNPVGPALQLCSDMTFDPALRQVEAKLRAERGDAAFLPTRLELAREVLKAARTGKVTGQQVQMFSLCSRLIK